MNASTSSEIQAFGRMWKKVFEEDNALRHDPDAEGFRDAWKRLFGSDWPGFSDAPEEDHGDTFCYLMPGGDRLYVMACDGNSLWVPA
jgi:hypothetical protein